MRNKELTLEITQMCNLTCAWCSSSSGPSGKHVRYDTVMDTLDRYQASCSTVRFSGGEPTLAPSLGRFLSYAKYIGYKTVLMTNGLYIPHDLYPQIDKFVDEYVINIVNFQSCLVVLELKKLGKTSVSMHVVMVEGNEKRIKEAMELSLDNSIPLRLLILQKQGRGLDCKPLDLITWTGDKGCSKLGKITVTHDGVITSCSALKYKSECPLALGVCQVES